MNRFGIGRPGAMAGIPQLVEWLKGEVAPASTQANGSSPSQVASGPSSQGVYYTTDPQKGSADPRASTCPTAARRKVVVLVENDKKENGDWPGWKGAEKLIAELKPVPGLELFHALIPDEAKDVREWLKDRKPRLDLADELDKLGDAFEGRLQLQPVPTAETPTADKTGLELESFKEKKFKPVDWVIKDYFARGKLHIVCGQGGIGKSRFTYDLAARLSRGDRWMGREYDPLPPMHVLLANCEDDAEDTIGPCLAAAGADLSRVHHIKAAVESDGKRVRFKLGYREQLRKEFQKNPEIGFLFVDPVGSFTGGGGYSAIVESDVKDLLDPLAELIREFGVTVLLVMHMNKGAGRRAMDRLMNSVAFGNTARAVFGIFEGEEDRDERDFLLMKYNLPGSPKGLTFRIRPLTASEQDAVGNQLLDQVEPGHWPKLAAQLAKPEFMRETERTADDANQADTASTEEVPPDIREAERHLKAFLAKGRQTARACIDYVSEQLDRDVAGKWLREKVYKARLKGQVLWVGQPPVVYWELPGSNP